MAVLVKSEQGSFVLVKARRKKRSTKTRKAFTYEQMFRHIFGTKSGTGAQGLDKLTTQTADASRRGAVEGASTEVREGGSQSYFRVGPGKNAGATRAEINNIIHMSGALAHFIQTGDTSQLERMKKQGHMSDKMMDLMMYNPEVQEGVMKFAAKAGEANVERERVALDVKGKAQHHSTINPETGEATAQPRRESAPETENKDFISALSNEPDVEPSGFSSLLEGGGDPLTDATESLRRPSDEEEDA